MVLRENANQKKYRLLGQPANTAGSRLRKTLLFNFAKRCNEDICYRCGIKIEDIKEFSIEHKNPWMSAEDPKESFFDITNIAFSHLLCNSNAAVRVGVRRVPISEDRLWCSIHKALLPIEMFWVDRTLRSGYRKRCKEHSHMHRKRA